MPSRSPIAPAVMGPCLQQQLDYLATGVAVSLRTDFHNTIVTEFDDKV